MAKKKRKRSKKKGTKRRRSTKKVKRRVVKKKNLAAPIGGAMTIMKTEMAPDAWGSTVLNAQKNAIIGLLKGDFDNPWIKHAARLTYVELLKNSGPALVGTAISFGEDIPLIGGLVREVKRPANRLLGKAQKMLTGRKPRFKL
jgi:hypothetical protein